MVRTTIAGSSRAASSRGGSVARDIMKKREKPYKTEYQKVMAKKRKLNLNTTYMSPPEGYTFLPVGTPDLADLCKILSKERDLPVSVAKPTSRIARDPTKLSHHVHRIGYHFHSEVVEQAVQDLHYTVHKGQFVKEDDLAKKARESAMAKTLDKWGITMQNVGTGDDASESPEQVRGAIKELFPKIPEDDLEEIVKHAWAEGTGRVGGAKALDLPRRVQLAVIARIRHTYTDYDRLLRAFEWAEARKMTEPVSLQKLIEWRGEHDVEEDDQLEEMVRETIIIDDDDNGNETETAANGSEADDEDSAAEQGDNSDASIEVTHHLADDTDIGGESTYEGQQSFLRRFQQAPRRSQRRGTLAKEKLAEAQRLRRNGTFGGPPASNVETAHVPRGINGRAPGSFEKNGVVYHPIPEQQGPQPLTAQALQSHQRGLYPPPNPPLFAAAQQPNGHGPFTRTLYPPPPPAHDLPVASIERQDGFASPSPYENSAQASSSHGHRRPVTPDRGYSSKRRRVEHAPQHSDHGFGARPMHGDVIDLLTPEQPQRRNAAPLRGEVVDLSTPEPQYQPVHPSPLREVRTMRNDYAHDAPYRRYEPVQDAALPHRPSPMRISPGQQMQANDSYQDDDDSLAYDPRQPMLQLPQQVDRLSIRPEQNIRATHSSMPVAYPSSPAQFPQQYAPQPPPQPSQYYQAPQQQAYPQYGPSQPMYSYPPQPPPQQVVYEQYPSRPTPQPIHGAPAPVQVIPRHAPYQPSYGRPPTVPPPVPPTDGAPAPAQYLPR